MNTTDITANRHGGNAQSIAANEVAEPTKAIMRLMIMTHLRGFGEATLKDLCRVFGKLPNEISGRLSELKAAGAIVPTGEVRERCAVYRVKD